MRFTTLHVKVLSTFLMLMLGQMLAFGQGYISAKVNRTKPYKGFFNFYWDVKQGKIWLEIDKFDEEFLFVTALSAGVGANEIGLDRSQLGGTRIVKFERIGPRVFLKEVNYKFRADSKDKDEQKTVEDAFAQSILAGFKVEAEQDGRALVDFTPFLMTDMHGVGGQLNRTGQGQYVLDRNRCAVYLESTKNFPKNSEFDVTLTFAGSGEGKWIQSVAPTAGAVTVRQHYSFVQLPDNQFEPRVFDPRSGYFPLEYYDYAAPIGEPVIKRFITRHRLIKKNKDESVSEPVKPIIYYVDRGVPEKIKKALIEGASWWNEAFEVAGFKNAFQVKTLPINQDPMDIRYNMINWVHRSTRGWSYGTTVTDPRTGEIIKGTVLLGSLRVRQDFLIAQGLIDAYENGTVADPRIEELALARLRQLSAHEIGHTLGLAHNFAASGNERASVMDYPHPFILLDNGKIDFSNAYETGIGAWDKRTIIYGYQEFGKKANVKERLQEILIENDKLGLNYISDEGARPIYGAHPNAHLWDNGLSPIDELDRLTKLRATALKNFNEKNIPVGMPMGALEDVLVPVYFMHRYQVEAVAKIIGGVEYTYAVRGDGKRPNTKVKAKLQEDALAALIRTLRPEFLAVPEEIMSFIPPQPIGYSEGREQFRGHTGITFDPLAAAESSAQHTINFLLNPERLARIVEHNSLNQSHISLINYVGQIIQGSRTGLRTASPYYKEIGWVVEKLVFNQLLNLAGDESIMRQVSAVSLYHINEQEKFFAGIIDKNEKALKFGEQGEEPELIAHLTYLLEQIRKFKNEPSEFKLPPIPEMPEGSPIGCSHMH